MLVRLRTISASASIIFVAAIHGCMAPEWHLDRVAKSIEDFGTVSISGATLIDPDPRFQLDLDLSGREIFERSRMEGFSNVSQFDSVDFQFSVKAQEAADLVDQMGATQDPVLFQQLKGQLSGVVLQGLMQNLPPEARAQLGALLPSGASVPAMGDRSTSGGPFVSQSDGGQGQLLSAQDKFAEATLKQKDSEAAINRITSTSAAPEKEQALTDAKARAKEGLVLCEKSTESARDGAESAFQLASTAQRRLAQESPEVRAQAAQISDQIAQAQTKANEARQAAAPILGLIKTGQSDIDALKDANKPDMPHETAAKFYVDDAAKPESIGAYLKKVSEVVASARAVSAIAGQPIGPTQRQLIEAPKIDPNDLMARKKIPPFRGVLQNPTAEPVLNLRQLLLMTAMDKQTLEMLRWLSYPRDTGPGKRVYLCMASVNVVPGRLTYQGYNGQVDLFMEYGRIEKLKGADNETMRVMKRLPGFGPTTFAVFPYLDTQVIDLRTSRRQAFTMALQLISNGYDKAARALLDFARQREQDAQTLTGLNTVTSYSNGSHLGFTFSPRFVAQGDPSDINTTPQMLLQPQSFPVIVMIVCDENYLDGAPVNPDLSKMDRAQVSTRNAPDLPSKGRSPLMPDVTNFHDSLSDNSRTVPKTNQESDKEGEERPEGIPTFSRGVIMPGIENIRPESFYENNKPDVQVKNSSNEASRLECQARGATPLGVLASKVEPSCNEEDDPATVTHLIWHQMYRWMRAPRPRADKWPFGRWASEAVTPRMTETQWMQNAKDLDEARNRLRKWDCLSALRPGLCREEEDEELQNQVSLRDQALLEESGWRFARETTYQEQVLRNRLNYLAASGVGTNIAFALPRFGQVTCHHENLIALNVSPQRAWIDQPSTLFIEANGKVFPQGATVSIGGNAVNSTKLSERVLKVTMPPWMDVVDPAIFNDEKKAKDLLTAEVVVTNGAFVKSAGTLTFSYYNTPRTPPPPASKPDDVKNLTAKFTGLKQTIKISDPLDINRIITIGLSKTITARAFIIIPQPTNGEWRFDASLNDKGVVSANQSLKPDADPAKPWTPFDLKPWLGKKIAGIDVELHFENGNRIRIPVEGVLEIVP